jgi:hypothetical protein
VNYNGLCYTKFEFVIRLILTAADSVSSRWYPRGSATAGVLAMFIVKLLADLRNPIWRMRP